MAEPGNIVVLPFCEQRWNEWKWQRCSAVVWKRLGDKGTAQRGKEKLFDLQVTSWRKDPEKVDVCWENYWMCSPLFVGGGKKFKLISSRSFVILIAAGRTRGDSCARPLAVSQQ